jgi:hypothetical protein
MHLTTRSVGRDMYEYEGTSRKTKSCWTAIMVGTMYRLDY